MARTRPRSPGGSWGSRINLYLHTHVRERVGLCFEIPGKTMTTAAVAPVVKDHDFFPIVPVVIWML